MSNTKIAFLLLHAGPNDPESVEVLDILVKSGNRAIVPIEVSDAETLNLIQHNTMGVTVTELPSIVVAQEGLKTQIYPGKSINTVIDMVNAITMNQETPITTK